MACGDVLSLEDLQTAKKHQIFEAEVITGKVGGVAGGAAIDTATNPVTGQTQQTLPSILADLGFDVQPWTSSTGGVLASANQVFLNDTPGSLGLGGYYAWSGPFQKTVPAGTDPALPTSGYIMRSSRFAGTQAREALRRSYAEAGYNLVNGSFEAGGTLENANDVLLQEASGGAYSWSGSYPTGGYDVTPGTNPVGNNNWSPRTDQILRNELSSAVGAALVSWQGSEAGQLKKKLSERFQSSFVVDFATEYLTMAEIEQIKIDYAVGTLDQKPTVDITARLIQAIADLGGSHDITSAYLYEPAKVLQLPAGAMGLNLDAMARVLVGRNNINIIGRGMFNTRLCHIGTGHANEMFRFKEAYACGLAHLTLDGGLPFTPVGTETYGVDIPLVLDQCAHFYSDGLNVCNFRHRGYQFTHLWESYFGDLRSFNGGWFRVSGSTPGGLFFDDFRKESTFFPGSESNQVYIGKYAFSGNGSIYQFKSPCFNMRINQVVSEARTYGSYVPPGIDSPKVVVSGLSSGVVIDQAWYYFHDQDAAAVGAGAVLFDFTNAGPGCYFNNQMVYQEIPAGSTGRALEVSKLIANGSAHPVNLQMSVEDRNCTTALFNSASAGSLILADLYYRNNTIRAIDSILGPFGQSNMQGKITVSTGNFTTVPPYTVELGLKKSAIDGSGVFSEYKCRAIGNINGTTGEIRSGKGFSSITKSSLGQYSFTFADPMPDANYAICPGAIYANLGDNIEVGGISPTGFSLVIRTAAGVYHDSPNVMVSVFR